MPIRPNFPPAPPALLRTARCVAGGLLCLALTTGCGGGSAATPAQPVLASAADATMSSNAAAADCGLAGLQAELLLRMNQWRSTGASCGAAGVYAPAATLSWNTRLQQAGFAHSQEMAKLDYFSHTGADGSTPAQRITAAGYEWFTIGENIAAGHTTAAQVMTAWMGSDPHCANLMNPAFTEVGVACVPGSASDTYRTYWSMELGKPLK